MRASIVGVYKGMLMNMRMVSDHGIDHDKHSARKHNSQRKQIQSGQLLMQYEERQKSTYKGRDRVISAGFRRAENALRPDIEENTQPIGHEAKNQCKGDVPKRRHPLSLDQRNHQRAEPTAESFNDDDLKCAPG